MDKLNIDFKSLLPYAIDAFTEVYGEEYRDIISKRINTAIIVPYYDIEGLSDYLSYIKRCKKREYSIKFLDKIGLDVKKHIKENYLEPLDVEIEKILDYYIDSSQFGFSEKTDYWVPLQAFKQNNESDPNKILRNKIKIINYLLGDDHEKITEENFNLFTETNEYQIILNKINELNEIYENLLSEYREWEAQLEPYQEYVENETKRKEDILKRKKISMFMDISDKLPLPIEIAISDKTIEKKCDIVLCDSYMDIGSKCFLEFFSHDQMEKLNSKDFPLISKYWIVRTQSEYLKRCGVVIPNEKMLKCDFEEDITEYLNFLSQDNVRKYIPSDDVISYITSVRERKYEEALREYYVTREDFVDAKRVFGNNEGNLEYIYDQIKNKRICIAGQGGTTNNNEFISIMFYTIKNNCGGILFHNFMHECGHIIDQSSKGTGFERFNDFIDSGIRNPYDKAFRKYEKFNETLNDIFTMEAVDLLHNQGIYLIEPKEFADKSDRNTHLITKNLLKPLLHKFRQQVIKAKVNADHEELIKYIGQENFEELVDAVNKVDFLSRNGVVAKIESSPEDEMVKEYFEQVERVKRIYINIDNYYRDNIESLLLASDEAVRKTR